MPRASRPSRRRPERAPSRLLRGWVWAAGAPVFLLSACLTPPAPTTPGGAEGTATAAAIAAAATAGVPTAAIGEESGGAGTAYPDGPAAGSAAGAYPDRAVAGAARRWPQAARQLGLPWLAQGPGLPSGEATTTSPVNVNEASTPPAGGAAAGSPPGSPGPVGPCAGMVGRQGGQLLLDGRPWRFFGVNATYLTEPDFPEAEVAPLLQGLARHRVTALRVWFQPGQDPERFQRLLDEGGRLGLRFLVTMGDNVHQGVDWFFGEEDEEVYRPHLEATVNRFKDRPEILAWEPVNEPNCGEGRFDEACVKTLRDWVVGTARVIKRIDACHLLSSGMIGAGNYDLDQDSYRRLHKKDEIDLISVHRGVDREAELERELAEEIGKPIVYGEIYDIANDEGCQPLPGRAGPGGRAGRVAEDLAQAWAEGVDGYLLWDLNLGQVRKTNGDRGYYCSKFGYPLEDPVWGRLAERGLLP